MTTISDVASYWPAWGFVLALLAWSLYHDTAYRRVLAAYAERRAGTGAAGGAAGIQGAEWPSPRLARELAANPAVLFSTAILAFVSAGLLGWATYLLTNDDTVGSTSDRRLAALACVALLVAGVWLVRAAVARYRSPWHPLASRLRRAIYASGQRRGEILAEALALDPELRQASSAR